MKTNGIIQTIALSTAMLSLSSVCYATPVGVFLQVGFDDPEVGQGDPSKTMPPIPSISIDGHVITFDTPCIGYQLQLTDNNGVVIYSSFISTDSITLPASLNGSYKLKIQDVGSLYYFYGYITL